MKVGDLIHMPGETVRENEAPSIGIVIDDNPPLTVGHKRIGIMWASNWGCVDWEPKGWLEVISECR